MKILIVSDTHGNEDRLKTVLDKTRPIDYFIHCGDLEGHEDRIRKMAGCPCTLVKGNNDFFSDLEKDEVIRLGKYRVFVTHGHRYGVSMTSEMLKDEAKQRGCSIAFFGHTHKPVIDDSDPYVVAVNPGSLTYPSQEGREPSYAIMEIDRKGEAHFTLNYLKSSPHGLA